MSLQCKTAQLNSPERENLTFHIDCTLLQIYTDIYYICFFWFSMNILSNNYNILLKFLVQ